MRLVLAAFALSLLLVTVVAINSFMVSAQAPGSCFSVKEQEHIRALTRQAIDAAFHNHVAKLFDVWVKDYTPEPQRARIGMANGISAYQRAQALKWEPVTCKE